MSDNENDDHKDEYEVGYGKPPRYSRFQAGQSGNPRGRPTGRKNLTTMIREILSEEVTISENGNIRKAPKGEAVLRQMLQSALKGDLRAGREMITIMRIVEQADPTHSESYQPNESDELVLARLMRRTQNINAVKTLKDKGNDLS